MLSEGGEDRAASVSGAVVSLGSPPVPSKSGHYAAPLSAIHTVAHRSSNESSKDKPGAEIITADIIDTEKAKVVTCLNIKSTYTEILGNFISLTLDTEKTVESVYVNGVSPLADNIPVLLPN